MTIQNKLKLHRTVPFVFGLNPKNHEVLCYEVVSVDGQSFDENFTILENFNNQLKTLRTADKYSLKIWCPDIKIHAESLPMTTI